MFTVLTWLVMAGLLVGSYFLNSLIYEWKWREALEAVDGSASKQLQSWLIGLLASTILVITNFVMQ